MAVCSICYASVPLQRLSCGCEFCKDCLYEWFKDQMMSFMRDELRIMCPAGKNQHEVTEKDVLSVCSSPTETAEFSHLLLKRYLLKLPDTRACPNSSCSYIGWLDLSQFCLSSVHCPLCLTSWKEANLYPWYLRIIVLTVKIAFGFKDEEGNDVWKWLWTKNCPKCKVSIEKNGGCSNMNCYKCKAAFCWTCLRLRREHNEGKCFLIYSHSMGMMLVLGMGVLMKIALVEPLFWYPLGVMCYCVGFFLYILALIITIACTCDTLGRFYSVSQLVLLFAWWVVFVSLTYCLLVSSLGPTILTHVAGLGLLAVHCIPLCVYFKALE